MAPTSAMLQGLNIVQQQPQTPSGTNGLLSTPPFSHDLAAQLDLWSSVHFASDEPFISNPDRDLDGGSQAYNDPELGSTARKTTVSDPALTASATESSHFYDHYLSGFTAESDPFDVAPVPNYTDSFAIDPALAQLSSSTDADQLTFNDDTPAKVKNSAPRSLNNPARIDGAGSDSIQPPASKKARTNRKAAKATIIAAPATPAALYGALDDDDEDHDDDVKTNDGSPDLTTPVTASEDKRRRNTAASARFRLKKKEREQAMERKAKDLESRVSELERECEGLRRENGWLKGLVVGVTGASIPSSGAPSAVSTKSISGVGSKRERDETA